jgi:hypothetical protein
MPNAYLTAYRAARNATRYANGPGLTPAYPRANGRPAASDG